MIGLIFFVGFFLLLDADSLAQVYKYVDQKGATCFTDTPPPFLFQEEPSNPKKESKQESKEALRKMRSKSEVKSILQLGEEVLKEEYAKPPEKQNRRLIQEMEQTLYGDLSSKKPKADSILPPKLADFQKKIFSAFGKSQ